MPDCDKDIRTLADTVARVEELDKRLTLRFELMDRAITVALLALDRRLDGMNEFRASLQDQTNQFVDRKEFDLRMKPIEEFITITRTRISITMWGIGAFFVIVQIVLRLLWSK